MPTKTITRNYLIFVAIILIVVLNLAGLHISRSSNYETNVISDDPRAAGINDSLPYYRYRLLHDSIAREEQCKKEKLSGAYNSFAGFTVIREQDNCRVNKTRSSSPETDKFYLVLPGYRLISSAGFVIKNGKYLLKNIVWDDKSASYRKGHYSYKEIPVRYTGSPADNSEAGLVLLPVTENQFRLIQVLTYFFLGVFALYGIFILIILPLRILHAISNGRIFNSKNISHLFLIGWSLIALALIPGILSIVLSIIFDKWIPGEFYLSFPEVLLQNKGILLGGLVLLLLAGAFRNGYKIQKENDLTI